MKRSRAVQAFLVVSAAAALSGCGQKHEASRRCVDENGLFAPDGNCGAPGTASGGHHYAWVYAPVGASNKTDEGRTEGRSGATSGAGDAAPGAKGQSEATTRGVIGGEGAAHAGASGGEGGGE